MKRIVLLSMTAVVLAVIFSCKRNDLVPIEVDGPKIGINATQEDFALADDGQSQNQVVTRVVEAAFQPDDSIGLFIHQTAAVGASGNHSSNVCYALVGGAWSAVDALSAELTPTSTYYVTSYHPYKKNTTNATAIAHKVEYDQSSAYVAAKAGALERSDFIMTATAQKITNLDSDPQVALGFKHLMNKFVVKFTIPQALDGVPVVGLKSVTYKSVLRSSVVNLATGVVSGATDSGDVIPRLVAGTGTPGTSVTYEAIVVPQTIKGSEHVLPLVEIVCDMGGSVTRPLSYTIPAAQNVVLASNEKYTLNLTSISQVAFLNEIDLLDGLAKQGLALKIQVPLDVDWTLTSDQSWLQLSTSAASGYASSITGKGKGLGVEQTVYVKVTANDSPSSGSLWNPRQSKITLATATASAYYTAIQNYYRFGVATSTLNLTAVQQSASAGGFFANQVWSALSSGTWALLSSSATYGDGDPKLTFGPIVGSLAANQLYYQLSVNNTSAARSATVVYTPATVGSLPISVTINQAAPDIKLSVATADAAKEAATNVNLFTVTAAKGIKWKILSITPEIGVNKNMNLALNVATNVEKTGDGAAFQLTGSYSENTQSFTRYSTVVVAFAAYGVTQQKSFVITQAAAGPQFITINGLKWTIGNLVADGANGCKAGEPGDGGLYFQYGGLIGYKGGATGDGTGIVDAAKHPDGKWWNGAAAYSANDIAVTPVGYTSSKTVWPYFDNVNVGGFGYYYYNAFVTKYADFQTQVNGKNILLGIGDPCAHYLGASWRLPQYDELSAITGNATEGAWVPWSTAGVTGRWVNNGPPAATTKGAWFGPNSRSGSPTTATDLFFPASGLRYCDYGAFIAVGVHGYAWSSSVYDARSGFHLNINESLGVVPRDRGNRAHGFPVRCVGVS